MPGNATGVTETDRDVTGAEADRVGVVSRRSRDWITRPSSLSICVSK